MSTVGFATLEVIPSMKGLQSNLERQSASSLTAAGRTGGKRFGDAAAKEASTSFRSRFASGLKGFAPLAGLVGTGALVAGLKSAIDGASDLAESTSKVQVVFGRASDSVLRFGANASTAMGQSQAQALEATGTFGNLLRSVGLSEEVSAKFSTTMVALASDLASFNNTSVDDALTALRSGLVGETEPLKRFGVNMNEAVLKAKALELGLSDGKSVLDSNAKAQAAYALILEQTKLAQGDFVRTSGGLANQQRILSAQWTEMKTSLGQELLPAMTGFVSFMNEQGLPALSAAGGFAKDAAVAFGDLPAPVQATAAAFVALKVASAAGLDSRNIGSARSLASAMDGLRLRTLFAKDAFAEARTVTREFAGTSARVSSGVGRISASMQGLRAASVGAGGALRSGLGSMVSFLGGPWGIAMIGATALVTHFWQEHQKAEAEVAASEQRVKSFTATLDENTGALTRNSQEFAAQELIGADILRQFEAVGISSSRVVNAVTQGGAALQHLQDQLDSMAQSQLSSFSVANQAAGGSALQIAVLTGALSAAAGEAEQGKDDFSTYARAVDDSATASKRGRDAIVDYKQQIHDTRTELRKLIEAEQERALNAIQAKRDHLALITTLQDAEKEARKGKKTLDEQTKAGQANMGALLDLAEQWSSSKPKVQNAEGAYENMRQKFIAVATEMGATDKRAEHLADTLLKVPKTAPLKFQSEGYQELIAQIHAVKEQARQAQVLVQFRTGQLEDRLGPALAGGGLLRGPGSGTSDSILMWGSNGEFMQPKRAVDYYGTAFMEAVRRMQFPKLPGYAQGGQIQPQAVAAPAGAGVSISIGQVVAHDYRDFMSQMQRRTTHAMSDGARMPA